MCGIVGLVSLTEKPADPERVRRGADVLRFRGPDDEGLWHEGPAALGHRRLAVLDVSMAGHQPMLSADQRYVIVYNGEIYNFIELKKELQPNGGWSSDSDTEMILAAYDRWGASCVERFQGMFSFAIWDRQRRELFAARDRMGVKPFYYCQAPNEFAFASRPKALWAVRPESAQDIDEQALRWYFEAGYVPAPHSIHRSIKKLPPAHRMTVSAAGIDIERYWDFRDIEPEQSWRDRHEEDLTDELEDLLSGIVRDRMISDVPVGAFLSGGIDSSLVVALMAKHSAGRVRTYTIGFDQPGFDESGHAQAVANHLGTDHSCEFHTVDELLNLLPTFSQEYDEPLYDSSALPLMAVSRLARRDVSVVLTGDGADELFGGYHYYDIARWIDRLHKLPGSVRCASAKLTSLIPLHRAKLLGGAMQQPDRLAGFAFSRGISKDYMSPLFSDVSMRTVGIADLFASQASAFPADLNLVDQATRIDAGLTLPDDYLQKVDIGSMAFSLEARDPFLDHRLVEWAMRLPTEWKLRGGTRKYLLRKLAYRHIPPSILDRPKMGFSVPMARWLRGPLRSWAEERISNRALCERGLLDHSALRALLDLHLSGAREVQPLLWAALMYLEFLTTLPGPGSGALQ